MFKPKFINLDAGFKPNFKQDDTSIDTNFDGYEVLKGEDGVSPIIESIKTEDGYKLKITDKENTEIIEILNGKEGSSGAQGPAGKDGAPGKDGKDGYTPIKGKDYFTEEEVQEIVDKVAEEMPTPVTSWNDLTDKPDFAPIATSGSWNDLEDKPFGVGAVEWKQIASHRETRAFNSVTSVAVFDLTLSVKLGRKYRIVFMDYGIGNIRIEATVIATQAASVTGPYISLGTNEDDIRGFQLTDVMPWTFNFKNTISFQVGYDLVIYEEVETITKLDEKYIPDIIARKTDIPNIPTKLSEFENDAGFITADDIAEVGVIKELFDTYILNINYELLLAFDTSEIIIGGVVTNTTAILGQATLDSLILA